MANYQFIDTKGINLGTSAGTAGAPANAVAADEYVVGVDDVYDDYPHSLATSTLKNNNSAGYSYNYLAEYYLLVNSSNGASFDVGEDVTQVVPGIDFDAVVTGFNSVVGGEWVWQWQSVSNQDFTNSALLTIRDCGPTGGTAINGPTGPTGGTAGYLGGPHGASGTPVPIVGASSAASWDVIGISQRVRPHYIATLFMELEQDGITLPDYTSVLYAVTGADGATMDLTNTSSNIYTLYDDVIENHAIWEGNSSDSNYINGVTVYNAAGTGILVDAVSGGSITGSSELTSMYYNYSTVLDDYNALIDGISSDYSGVGTTPAYDSVHKVRTFYEGRNP